MTENALVPSNDIEVSVIGVRQPGLHPWVIVLPSDRGEVTVILLSVESFFDFSAP
jgi:hypothetical protein